MRAVALRDLLGDLVEYVQAARSGERLLITQQGQVVAELRPFEAGLLPEAAGGMAELVRRGLARRVVRNSPEAYREAEPVLVGVKASELLDWERGER